MHDKKKAERSDWVIRSSFDINILTSEGQYFLPNVPTEIFSIIVKYRRSWNQDKTIRMEIVFTNTEKAVSFCKKLNNHSIHKKISYSDGVHDLEKMISNKLWIQTEIKEDFIVVFRELVELEPSTMVVLHDLRKGLEIHDLYTLSDLKEMKPEDAISLAKHAQCLGFYELIWVLSKTYYDDTLLIEPNYPIDTEVLYEFLKAISEDNPYYKLAQDTCVDLLMRLEIGDKEEKMTYLEYKFCHALAGTRQDLTDRLYDELCGNPFGAEPYVKNIKGDPELLINIANRMRLLNENKLELENKLQLEDELKLEKKIGYSFF